MPTSTVVPTTAAGQAAASIGNNYCEHTGFAFCEKCDSRNTLQVRQKNVKANLKRLQTYPPHLDLNSAGLVEEISDDSDSSIRDDEEVHAEEDIVEPVQELVEEVEQKHHKEEWEYDPCTRCARRYTNLACFLFLTGIALLTIAMGTPLFFYGKRDYDIPVYSHTYIHCNEALQYNDDWYFAGIDTDAMNADRCQTLCTAAPGGEGEETYRYFGLQYGSRCYCSNFFPQDPKREEFCDVTCTADIGSEDGDREICGDLDYSSTYIINCFTQFNPEAQTTFTDDEELAILLTVNDEDTQCDLVWEPYEMALLAMGGFVAACGLFFMGICCCRTVSIGPYHEKNQKIDFNGLKKLFPKAPTPWLVRALKQSRHNKPRAVAILQSGYQPRHIRRPRVRIKKDVEAQ